MRDWLRSRAGLKVVSLVLALVTWFFVKAVTSDSRTVENVPLEIRVKPGLVANASAKSLSVTVRGTTDDVRLAARNELYAVLDLTREEKPGKVEAPIPPKLIRHPRRVRVVAVDPPSVTVQIESATE